MNSGRLDAEARRVRGRRGRPDALHGPRDGVRMHQTQAKVSLPKETATRGNGFAQNPQKLQPWEIAFNDRAKRCAQTNGAGNEPAT